MEHHLWNFQVGSFFTHLVMLDMTHFLGLDIGYCSGLGFEVAGRRLKKCQQNLGA